MFGIGVPRSGTPWNKDWAPGGSKQTGGNRPPLGGGSPPMSGGMRGASVLPGFARGARAPYMGTQTLSATGGGQLPSMPGANGGLRNNYIPPNAPMLDTIGIDNSARGFGPPLSGGIRPSPFQPPPPNISPRPSDMSGPFTPGGFPAFPGGQSPPDMSGPFTPGGFPAFPGGQPPPQSSGMPVVPGSVPGYDPNAGAARRNLINSILGASRPPPKGISI